MGNNATHGLRQEVINEIKARTDLTSEQIRRLFRDFSQLNHGKAWSRSVSVDDLATLYDEIYQGESREFARIIFDVMDADKNGGVDFYEYVTSFVQLNGAEENKLGWLFSLYDHDQRGYIYYDDLVKVVQAVMNLLNKDMFGEKRTAETIATEILHSVDKNRDNRISSAEFIEGATSCSTLWELLKASTDAAGKAYNMQMQTTLQTPCPQRFRPRAISTVSAPNSLAAKRRRNTMA